MSAPRFTLGPWGCATRRGSWDWVVYRDADPNIEICQLFHDGTDLNEVGDANARLIAAAPELYSELERLTDLLKRNGYATGDADALLARARGDAS